MTYFLLQTDEPKSADTIASELTSPVAEKPGKSEQPKPEMVNKLAKTKTQPPVTDQETAQTEAHQLQASPTAESAVQEEVPATEEALADETAEIAQVDVDTRLFTPDLVEPAPVAVLIP